VRTYADPIFICEDCGAEGKRTAPNIKVCSGCRHLRQLAANRAWHAGEAAAGRKRQRDPEHERERRRRSREANPEAHADYGRQWRAKNLAKIHAQTRARRHGTTVEILENMFQIQEGLCAICSQPLPENFHVDHDHRTGHIRGLLCPSCNKGLGHFGDDYGRLLDAAAYLMAGHEVREWLQRDGKAIRDPHDDVVRT
jgi:Recombination endonuclease VII